MQAVMSAGKESTPMHNHGKWLCIGAAAMCMLVAPCMAQTDAVDQIERLLKMQHRMQQEQAQQLTSLQSQLLEHNNANAAQDWQWVMWCALGLLGMAAFAWAAKFWHAHKAAHFSPMSPAPESQEPIEATLFAPPVIDTAEPALGTFRRNSSAQQEDDWDSQLLADEALREFELRRTVGLIPEAQAQTTGARPALEQSIEQAWADMHEVALDVDDAGPTVDLSLEVQKVRKNLHLRRLQRTQAQAAPFAASGAALPHTEDKNFAAEPDMPPEEEEAIVCAAASPAAREPQAAAERVPQEVAAPTPVFALPLTSRHSTLTQSPADFSSAELIFPASQRSMSEMEVRLALAQEFRRLGQIEEAEQLCNEALQAGNTAEQRSARQLLESLPGR